MSSRSIIDRAMVDAASGVDNRAVSAPGSRLSTRIVVTDDLRRWRLTVFFRLLLAIPHLLWLAIWSIGAFVVGFVAWLAVLIERRVPRGIHDFLAGYIRYATHVGAYVGLAASPYPGFRGAPGYPVDVEIDPPAEQSRLGGLFRLILAVPALILAAVLGSATSTAWSAAGSADENSYYVSFGIAGVAAFLAWFACLVRGRMPRGLRDLTAWCLGYTAQALAYTLLVTGRYPYASPDASVDDRELPDHPVRL